MKKAIIIAGMFLLAITAFLSAQAVDLFENGFETWPPPGWILNGVAWVSATTTTDPAVEPTSPYEGNYCAGMSSAPTNYLISPLKNNPGAYYFFVHKKDTGNYQFIVEFQVEDGLAPGANLTGPWSLVGEYWAHLGWWDPLTIDLTGYAPGYIKIRPTPPPPTPLKYMYFDKYSPLLPVELSSFTATTTQQLDQTMVELRWTTQSESEIAGYNVFRNETNDITTAMQLNLTMVGATNTSVTTNYSYVDQETEPGTWYYWLQSNELNGYTEFYGPISIMVSNNQGGETPAVIGLSTELKNAYPNPFNPQTTIPFLLTAKSNVKLEIFNQKGQRVWTYTKDNADAGLYHVEWNSIGTNGKRLPSGTYYCRMSSDNYLGVKKLILIK